MSKSSQGIFFNANSHFGSFNAKPSLYSLSNTLFTIRLWSENDPSVTIKISSKKQMTPGILQRVLSIAFWNSLGMAESP